MALSTSTQVTSEVATAPFSAKSALAKSSEVRPTRDTRVPMRTLPGKNNLEKTSWKLTNTGEDYFIEFESKDEAFKGKFKITFYSESDFNKVDLVSQTTSIKCSKSEFQESPK